MKVAEMKVQAKPAASLGLRQRLWRWHFFAGLMVCPFMILLSITGSIYLFKPQIDRFEETQINAVAAPLAAHQALGGQTLLEGVLKAYPGMQLKRYTLAKFDDPSVEIELKPVSAHDDSHQHHAPVASEELTVWVDRSNGQILAEKVSNDRFLQVVKKLHSELLLGDRASYVVELVACWGIILLVSGFFLWTKKASADASNLQFRAARQIFASPARVNGRWHVKNLHGLLGTILMLPLLFMLLTGLPWTQLWGDGFKDFKKLVGWSGPGQEWFVTLKSDKAAAARLEAESMLWEISDADEPASPGHAPSHDWQVSLTEIERRDELMNLAHPIHIMPPKPNNGVWSVRAMSQDRSERVTMHFDQYSGDSIMRIGFEDHHPVQRVISHGISLHEGALFGWFNQALVLLTALLTIALSVAGLVIWWQRRPSGAFAVPTKSAQSLPWSWVTIIVLLGAFLPAAGLSMVAVLLIDWVWQLLSAMVRPSTADALSDLE